MQSLSLLLIVLRLRCFFLCGFDLLSRTSFLCTGHALPRPDIAPPPSFFLTLIAHVLAVVTLAAPSDTRHLADLLARRDPDIEKLGRGRVTIGGINWEIEQQMLADFRAHDLPATIPDIKAATLLFHSPNDETVSFDHALRIMGLMQNTPVTPNVPSLIALQNADHLLVKNPADLQFVADTTAAFLNRYAKPT